MPCPRCAGELPDDVLPRREAREQPVLKLEPVSKKAAKAKAAIVSGRLLLRPKARARRMEPQPPGSRSSGSLLVRGLPSTDDSSQLARGLARRGGNEILDPENKKERRRSTRREGRGKDSRSKSKRRTDIADPEEESRKSGKVRKMHYSRKKRG